MSLFFAFVDFCQQQQSNNPRNIIGRAQEKQSPPSYLSYSSWFSRLFLPFLSRLVIVSIHRRGQALRWTLLSISFCFSPNCVIVFGISVHDNFLFLSQFLSFLFCRIIFPTLSIGDEGGEKKKGSSSFFTLLVYFCWPVLALFVCWRFPAKSSTCTIVRPIHVTGIITYGQDALNVIVSTCLFDMARSAVPQQQRSTSSWALSLSKHLEYPYRLKINMLQFCCKL